MRPDVQDAELVVTAGTTSGYRALAELPFSLVNHNDSLSMASMHVELFRASRDTADSVGMHLVVAAVTSHTGLWRTSRRYVYPDGSR